MEDKQEEKRELVAARARGECGKKGKKGGGNEEKEAGVMYVKMGAKQVETCEEVEECEEVERLRGTPKSAINVNSVGKTTKPNQKLDTVYEKKCKGVIKSYTPSSEESDVEDLFGIHRLLPACDRLLHKSALNQEKNNILKIKVHEKIAKLIRQKSANGTMQYALIPCPKEHVRELQRLLIEVGGLDYKQFTKFEDIEGVKPKKLGLESSESMNGNLKLKSTPPSNAMNDINNENGRNASQNLMGLASAIKATADLQGNGTKYRSSTGDEVLLRAQEAYKNQTGKSKKRKYDGDHAETLNEEEEKTSDVTIGKLRDEMRMVLASHVESPPNPKATIGSVVPIIDVITETFPRRATTDTRLKIIIEQCRNRGITMADIKPEMKDVSKNFTATTPDEQCATLINYTTALKISDGRDAGEIFVPMTSENDAKVLAWVSARRCYEL